jgi:hypothetical protein
MVEAKHRSLGFARDDKGWLGMTGDEAPRIACDRRIRYAADAHEGHPYGRTCRQYTEDNNEGAIPIKVAAHR